MKPAAFSGQFDQSIWMLFMKSDQSMAIWNGTFCKIINITPQAKSWITVVFSLSDLITVLPYLIIVEFFGF